jgi:transcriptional regulator with XRE-family HTH domain
MLNLTQKQFSEIIGITQAHLSGVESGKDNPSESMLKVISNEFQATIHWLKSGEEPIFRIINDVESFIASLPIEDRPPHIADDLKVVLENKNEKVQKAFHEIIVLFNNMTSSTSTTSGYDLLMTDVFFRMLHSIESCFSECNNIVDSVNGAIEKNDLFKMLGEISKNIMECKHWLSSDLDSLQKLLLDKLEMHK